MCLFVHECLYIQKPIAILRGKAVWRWPLLVLALLVTLGVLLWPRPPVNSAHAQADGTGSLTGQVLDQQKQPICHAEVALYLDDAPEPKQVVETPCDGLFLIDLPEGTHQAVRLEVDRTHFSATAWQANTDELAQLNRGETLRLPTFELERHIAAGFWIATATFVFVLLLIALEKLHNTLAALLGVAVIFIASALGLLLHESLFIFDFEQALSYVNFEVIFLVMGMMIVIAAIEETGIFQWMTYQAYRASRGRIWLLVIILMILTSVASALLDNVTTMLLMAPLTIQIALALEINPLSLLLPEVLASNVGGISTLIGTPTNILIGSFAKLSFNDFLINLTPGVLMAQAALTVYVILVYRKQWHKAGGGISKALLKRLEEAGQIKEPVKLRKAGIVFAGMLIAFVLGESLHLAPAVTAIVGAVVMLLWVAPDIEVMMQLVDWTTLMFFIALFILVGAIQEVGLLSVIAGGIRHIVGDNVTVALLVLTWSAALLSGVVANIPFTAAMLPVVRFLSGSVPGATSNVLYYALSVGSAIGGNSSLIGASANMVTAGIAERAGYRIRYLDFLKIGLPATIITVAVGVVWLLIRF